MANRGPEAFRGRAGERALLARLLENLRGGQSAVLVIRGEAGVGKTALLQDCAREATGVRVARIAGVESEMELPFAGLHQLCAPMLGRLSVLPEPQKIALRVALGLSSGEAPDRFLVALAALTLLADGAAEQPLLCIVDDAQWLDGASAQVLGFVARRLLAESVALVFAVRDPAEPRELLGLPELHLEGLPDEDARALLATVIPGRIDERVRDRIVAETRGNPLALLELPRGLSTAQLAGGFGLPQPQPLSGRIEESFLRRLEELPRETQQLLVVAAAEPAGDPALMWSAAARLGVSGMALEPAAQIGMLDIGAQVRFRHPLVRSAVYRSASEPERRTVHRALAEETDAQFEPDRRAWHRAQATEGPDEEVATELERSAGRAQARGGLAAAAAFLGRAADLTVEPARRAERQLAAAQAHLQAGSFDAALGLLASARAGPLDALGRARADLLRAEVAYAHDRGGDAPPLLLRAARTLEPLDARLSRDTYLDAWGAALFAGRLARAGGLLEVSRTARNAPRAAGPPRPCDLLLDGFALVFTEGRAAASPVLQRAAGGFAGSEVSVEEALRWGWLATAAAVYLWDFDTCLAVATRGVELARDSGALEVLAVSVNVLGQAVALSGDFATAALLIAEADAVREATGTRVGPYGALVLAALRGHEPEASELIRAHHQGRHRGRPGDRGPVRALGQRRRHERARPLRRGARRGDRGERRHTGAVRLDVVAQRADRGRLQDAGHQARGAWAAAAAGAHARERRRLGAGSRGAGARAAERGCGRRAPVPRGDRPPGTDPAAPGARARATALRGVAAACRPPRRRAGAASGRARRVRRDGRRRVRRARTARAAGHRREGAQAHP